MDSNLGPAKGKDSATSVGLFLATPDEIAPYRKDKSFGLRMTATADGEPYSEGNWSTIHWSLAQMISYASPGYDAARRLCESGGKRQYWAFPTTHERHMWHERRYAPIHDLDPHRAGQV